MAFCPNCGAQINDGARFCSECGSAVESVQQPEPQAQAYYQQDSYPQDPYQEPYQQDPYQQPMGNAYGNSNYQTLGGWLLFFVIGWGLSAVSGLGTIAQSIASLGTLTSYYGAAYIFPTLLAVLTAVMSMAVDVIMVICIIKRVPTFLRLYQILSIVELCASALSTIVYAIFLMETAGLLIGGVAAGAVGGAVGLILMTMYFCKSVRVRTYMGTTEYLDTALFKIGA